MVPLPRKSADLPRVSRSASAPHLGVHKTREPVTVVVGRALRPGFRTGSRRTPARGGGDLPGCKPIAFCPFLFQQLGMLPGDELTDLFPRTGTWVAWAQPRRAVAPPRHAAAIDVSR
jgi:hypothetical protein